MLTKLTIRNFKLFEEVEVPLGSGFVFLGSNNGGKTSALQALTLWHTGLKKWEERHMQKSKMGIPSKHLGVPVTRKDSPENSRVFRNLRKPLLFDLCGVLTKEVADDFKILSVTQFCTLYTQYATTP